MLNNITYINSAFSIITILKNNRSVLELTPEDASTRCDYF